MCKCCDFRLSNNVRKVKDSFDNKVTIRKSGSFNTYELYINNGNETAVPIRYCPFCGRKLE